jgi:putative holliday junction resolvase
MLRMKYLGIDYGDKRVGVSISDESGKFAFPYKVIENVHDLADKVKEIILREEIHTVVVGESLDFHGQPNMVMKNIERFVEELKNKTEARVCYEPEFLTSVQAERTTGKNDMNDASAAAIILQSFLDKHR